MSDDQDQDLDLDLDRLDRLRHDVLARTSGRRPGGALAARRQGARRRTTRLVGVAVLVGAVVTAVPVGVALSGSSGRPDAAQVATQEPAPRPTGPTSTSAPTSVPTSVPAPPTAAPPEPVVTGIAGSPHDGPSTVGSPGTVSTLSGPPAEDVAALAAATVVDLQAGPWDEVGFVSPSGNIDCGLHTSAGGFEVFCRVKDAEWEPDVGRMCRPVDATRGVGLVEDERGAVISRAGRCGTDSPLLEDPVPLAYGTAVVVGGIRCASLMTGVVCQDTAGASGFHVSRTAASLW